MKEADFPFNVGDAVWFVTRFETQRCTVRRVNNLNFEPYDVATVSVELEGGQRMACFPENLHLEPPPPKPKRSYTFEEIVAGFRFKPGDRVMQSNYGFGVVLGYSPTLNMRVDFKYFGERAVDPEAYDVWFAEPGDEDWNPLLPPEPYPEPLCAPELATVANFVEELEIWEELISRFDLVRLVCQSEYQLYLSYREAIHGFVNGLGQAGIPIPTDLEQRLAAADQAFIELTEEDYCVWPYDAERYDKQLFWYYFRWPIHESPS